MSKKFTEEEKGKARVIATMCGGVIPAWALPDDENKPVKEDENNENDG